MAYTCAAKRCRCRPFCRKRPVGLGRFFRRFSDETSRSTLMSARVELFGVEIDPLRMDQAVAQILAWVADPAPRCRFVVTPNVDHVVMLQYHAGLKAAYGDAGMVLVDGAPVLWSSRL